MTDDTSIKPNDERSTGVTRARSRYAYSDHSMPGLILVAIFFILLVAGIVYASYRVFLLEQDRLELNVRQKEVIHKENLLKGKAAAVIEAKQVHDKLVKLQEASSVAQKQVEALGKDAKRLMKKRESLSAQIENGRVKLTDLKKNLANHHQQLIKFKKDQDRLEEDIAELQGNFSIELARLSSLTTTKKELEDGISNLTVSVAALEAKKVTYEQFANEREIIREIKQELTATVSDFKEGIADVNDAAIKLQSATNEFQDSASSTLGNLSKRVSDGISEIDSSTTKLAVAAKRYTESTAVVKEAESALTEAASLLARTATEAKEGLANDTEVFAADVTRLREESDQAIDKLTADVSAGRYKIAAVLDEFRKSVGALSKQTVSFDQEREDLLKTKEKFDVQVRKAGDEIENAITALTTHSDGLSSSLIQLGEEQGSLSDLVSTLHDHGSLLNKEIGELGLAKEDLQQQTGLVQTSQSKIEKVGREIATSLEKYSNQFALLQDQLDQVKNTFLKQETIDNTLDEFLTKLDGIKRNASEVDVDLRRIVSDIEKSAERYQTVVDSSGRSLEERLNDFEALLATLEELVVTRSTNNNAVRGNDDR